jgi:hypothetical protein
LGRGLHRPGRYPCNNAYQGKELQPFGSFGCREARFTKSHHALNGYAILDEVDRQNGCDSAAQRMSRHVRLVARLQIRFEVLVDESSHAVESGVNRYGDRAIFANGKTEILSPVLVVVRPADRDDLDMVPVILFKKIQDVGVSR